MANIPLYNNHKVPNALNDGNLGLWYNKFANEWDSFSSPRLKFNKSAWVDSVAKTTRRYADTAQLAKLAGINNTICYTTTEPMIIGMGQNHPVENGMLFHHTLGVPYLPGSSVKGLVRAWAEYWEENKTPQFKRIFGADSKNDTNTQVGSIIFFDALPIKPVTLKSDIMTPHYPEYYGSQGQKPPSDNDSPIPIPFLTVEAGAQFLFAFKARKNAQDGDIKQVKQWLKMALELLGAGAKTAVGYGRMDKIACPELETPESLWVKKFITSVKKEHNIPQDDVALKSRSLATFWTQIEDSLLKEKVKTYVLGKCQPSKKALRIYDE